MKIYYSSNMVSLKFKKEEIPSIGVLISYFGLSNIEGFEYCDSLFLDSGAYSAWTQNVEIKVQDYISFIKNQNVKPEIIVSLDNIIDYKISLENYYEMKKVGFNPLPCFHYGEPFWVLKKYIEETNYIALGGVAKSNKKERIKWLDRIFRLYPKVQKIGFHGFGIQDRDILLKFPWKSVDASSAHMMARYGGICTPWGDIKINPAVNFKYLEWVSPESELKLKKWVNKLNFGLCYEEAKNNNMKGMRMRLKINICYYEQFIKNHIKTYSPISIQRGLLFK